MTKVLDIYSFSGEMDLDGSTICKDSMLHMTRNTCVLEKGEKVHSFVGSQDSLRVQEPFNSIPKENLSFHKDKKHAGKFKSKMDQKKKGRTNCRNLELKNTTSNSSKIPNVQGEKSSSTPSSKGSPHPVFTESWICKNSACKAVLSSDDTFCKRCSCCICHLFDDNKDPSLWLVCASESGDSDSCGLSCHIECAIQHKKAGVATLGQSMQIDGSYCCASCGKISCILGFWKKQLIIAKDARRVDVLCYRIFLSYRLLDGTSHFKVLYEMVRDAKEKLENEVGPLTSVSFKMARGIVSRLLVAADVQKLCCLAIEKADEWLSKIDQSGGKYSLPAACKFMFEEVTSSSMVIILNETSLSESIAIQGYKLWYFKSREQELEMIPVIFPRNQTRILISNLQPCTEYTFRVISFTESGDFGHSESKCFTRSVEIIHKSSDIFRNRGSSSAEKETRHMNNGSSGFKVRNLGKILRLAWAQKHNGPQGCCTDCIEGEFCGVDGQLGPEPSEEEHPHNLLSCGLDLNVLSALGMNANLVDHDGCSQGADDGCTSDKNGHTRSDGSDDSQTCTIKLFGEVPAVESNIYRKRARITNEEVYDSDSTLVNGSPPRSLNGCRILDDNYEYCVKIVRWLECGGHIEKDFRMRFLTWFSLRSTEQERRVVHTFIRTLVEDPASLAGQLADTFSGIIACEGMPIGSFGKI